VSDEELRAIEIDENVERQALTDYESTKARLAEIRQIEARLKAEAAEEAAKAKANTAGTPRKKRGRPQKTASTRAIAKASGVPDRTRRDMEKQGGTFGHTCWLRCEAFERFLTRMLRESGQNSRITLRRSRLNPTVSATWL